MQAWILQSAVSMGTSHKIPHLVVLDFWLGHYGGVPWGNFVDKFIVLQKCEI